MWSVVTSESVPIEAQPFVYRLLTTSLARPDSIVNIVKASFFCKADTNHSLGSTNQHHKSFDTASNILSLETHLDDREQQIERFVYIFMKYDI